MNFFKRIFTSNNRTCDTVRKNEGSNFQGITSTEYLNERYVEDNINPEMLDGCLKMIESYFVDNKIERKIENPINHPINLDQVDREGFGFVLYCKAFQLDELQAIMFMAYAFSGYLVDHLNFKLYQDLKPEYPLRTMTLKYDKDGVLLSLYPYEYASKVLNEGTSFKKLLAKVTAQINEMAIAKAEFKKFTAGEDGNF